MPMYNGFTHEERVAGWQCIWWMIDNKVMSPPSICAISGMAGSLHYHCEDYYHPWDAIPLAQPIHLALHRRFNRPEAWQHIVATYAVSRQEWFARLKPRPIDLASALRAEKGPEICDVFRRAAEKFPNLQPDAKIDRCFALPVVNSPASRLPVQP